MIWRNPKAKLTMREQEHKDTTEYWDRLYDDNKYEYLDLPGAANLYKTLAHFAKECHAHTILDIGCGRGNLLKYLDNIVLYTGVDISSSALEEARKISTSFKKELKLGNFKTYPAVNFTPPLDKNTTYDLIYFSGILAYLKNVDNSRIEMITAFADIHEPHHLAIATLLPWHDLDLDRDILGTELFPKRYKLVHDKTLVLQIEQYAQRRILLLEVLS